MEDLATDRIYRLMIAQRINHSGEVQILDDAGRAVRHTPELIHELFGQELDRLLAEGEKSGDSATLREAARISDEMIHRGEFNPV
jgi:malate synthase